MSRILTPGTSAIKIVALGDHSPEDTTHAKLHDGDTFVYYTAVYPVWHKGAIRPHEARSLAELTSAVEKGLSKVGLMLFMQLDHGAVVRKETGRETPKIVRFIIGNPLIMKEMAKHVPDAGSYAPVTVLVDERADGVHLSYDRMASFLAPYEDHDALEVARNLDTKIEDLLRQAAA
jgi:uncharacterized protein (DUF302 family)